MTDGPDGIDGPPRPTGREVDRLRERLTEVEEALLAVRAGQVDALVVGAAGDEKVAVFSGAMLPYRVMVESLGERARPR